MQSGAIVREHMHKELEGAEDRMRLLQQEIALIRTQVCDKIPYSKILPLLLKR